MIRLLVLLSVLIKVAYLQPTGIAMFSCINPDTTDTNDDIIVFKFANAGTDDFMRAFVKSFEDDMLGTNPCFSNVGPFEIMVKVGDCGTSLGTPAPNQAQIVVILAHELMVIQSDDFMYTITCDFSMETQQNVTLVGTAVNLDPMVGTPLQLSEDVVLKIVDPDDADPTASQAACGLGQNMQLRLELTKSTTAKGVRAVSCLAKDTDQNGMKSIDLITGSCAVPLAAPRLASAFGNPAADDPPLFVSNTGDFLCFRFDGSAIVYFECTVSFCQSVSDNTCAMDNCANQPAGRKRRETSEEGASENVSVVVNIGRADTRYQANEVCNGHMPNEVFIAVVTILAIVLVVSICTSLVIFKRAMKNAPMVKGLDNPSF